MHLLAAFTVDIMLRDGNWYASIEMLGKCQIELEFKGKFSRKRF
jgi:hypothetical protein